MRSSAIILLITAAALNGQTPLSVCEVLKRLDELHGKRITVKARYRTGGEIANLFDPACPGPALVDGVQRAAAIHVTGHLTEAANNRLRPLFTNALDEGNAIELTVEGEFHSQQAGPRVFGHLGVYPAELRISRIIHFHSFKDPNGRAWSGLSRERGRELEGLYGAGCPELRAAIDTHFALPVPELAKIKAVVDKTKQDGSAIDAIFLGQFTRQTGPVGFGHLGVYPAKLRVTQVLRFQTVADLFHPANMDWK